MNTKDITKPTLTSITSSTTNTERYFLNNSTTNSMPVQMTFKGNNKTVNEGDNNTTHCGDKFTSSVGDDCLNSGDNAIIEQIDDHKTQKGDKVLKITKCSSCEKLFDLGVSETLSCVDCLEHRIKEILCENTVNLNSSEKHIKSNMVDNKHGSVTAEQCCCSCHHSSSLENSTDEVNNHTQGTDTLTNIEVAHDEQSTATAVTADAKSTTSERLERICRICLDNGGDLIAPCKCSGSTKYAHESCLLKWFFKSSKKSCEVCLGNVNVTPIGYKPVQEWRLPDRGCDFIVYLFGLYFLIMVIFTGMITWIATQGCTSPVCVTLYAVCGIALLYFFYCCGCVEYSRRYWRALLSVNRIWRIYGREDSLKNFHYQITPKANKKHVVITMQAPSTETVVPALPNVRPPFVIEVSENRSVERGLDNLAADYDDDNVETVQENQTNVVTS